MMRNGDGEWWQWMIVVNDGDIDNMLFYMTMIIAFEIGDSDADENGNSILIVVDEQKGY